MRSRAMLALAVVVTLPSIGLAQKVVFDYDHGTDFSKFHTYRLVKIAESPQVNQLMDQRITASLQETLAKKGLQPAPSGGDLFIGYQASVTSQTQYSTFNDGMGPWGFGAGWGTSMSTTTTTNIPIGALTIDMMDPSKKQLVFRGTATDTLSDKPEKNAAKIPKAIEKILAKFPPKK